MLHVVKEKEVEASGREEWREAKREERRKEGRRNDLMKGEMQGDSFYMKILTVLSLKSGAICRSPNLSSLLDVAPGGKAGTVGSP